MTIKEELSQSRRNYLKNKVALPEAAARFEKEILEPLFRKYHEESPSLKDLNLVVIMKEKVGGWATKYFIYKGEKEESKNYMDCLENYTMAGTSYYYEEVLDAATEISGDIKGRRGAKMWIFSLSLDD